MPLHLMSFLRAQRKRISLFVSMTSITAFLAISRGWVYGLLIQSLLDAQQSGDRQIFYTTMWYIVGIELVLFVIRLPYDFLYSRCRGYMNIHARVFGVDKVVTQKYSELAKIGSGKLLQIVHNGMDGYSYFIYDGLRQSIEIGISLLVLMFSIGWKNARFLLFFVIGAGVLYFFQRYAFKRLANVRLRERDLNENYTKQTAKILMNFLLINIYGIKKTELATLRSIGEQRVDNYAYLKFWFNGVASAGNFLLILLMLSTTAWFGYGVLVGTTSIGYMMTIFFLTNFSREKFYGFGIFLAEIAEKLTYIHRFDEMTTQDLQDESVTTLLSTFEHAIVYEDISFGYEANTILLDQFSLTIPRGQKIAIMGKSGSGKSTVCKLLTKLILPSDGTISFQNDTQKIPSDTVSVVELYRHVGYLYQEPLVFDGTIGENISLHTPVSKKTLEDALVSVGLDHLGLDTIIGEQGLLLSGGEKQRVALARAFVFDYDVLLLDEPTSNLDLELEQQILHGLFKRYANKTIICITHRPFVLDMVDRVLTMRHGMIVEDVVK